MSAAPANPDRRPLQRIAERLIAAIAVPVYRMRRRLATALVVAAALGFAYSAIFGENGIDMFEQKRAEDHAIHQHIMDLQQQNQKLRQSIQELRSDPDAIEHEARERLHYARPGEVIWTENAPPAAAAPQSK